VDKQDELKPYRTYGLTLLQMMSVVATAGIVATVVLHYLLG
jgi:Tfp pilus assembly protein PilE